MGFYPRAREGRDLLVRVFADDSRVSIRAPVKDATRRIVWQRYHINSFYPRAREGRDLRNGISLIKITGFYPRAREGRD